MVKIDHPYVAAVPIRTTTSSRPGAHMTTETSAGERARLPPHLDIGGIIELADHGAGRLQLEGNLRDQQLGATSPTMLFEALDSPRCGHFVVSRPFVPPLQGNLRRTKCGPITNLAPVGRPPAGEILCYRKGFLWRAQGDSNTQPPDP